MLFACRYICSLSFSQSGTQTNQRRHHSSPIAGFWDPSLPGAVCLPIKALLMLTGILNSVTDFLVFLWPVNTLWKIHLPLLQRISLVVAFGIGCLYVKYPYCTKLIMEINKTIACA